MSYEPSRSKAYENDLRWRIVYQLRALECSVMRVSDNLGVSPSTVRRIGRLFDTTGSIDKKSRLDGGQALKLLTSYDEWMIMELVLERPGIYLLEICRELRHFTGTEVSEATVCRFLQKAGFMRTKIQHVALEQSEDRRARYLLKCSSTRQVCLSLLTKLAQTVGTL